MRIKAKNYILRLGLVLMAGLLSNDTLSKAFTVQQNQSEPQMQPQPQIRTGQTREEQIKRAVVDTRSLQEVGSSVGADLFTQTEAYFQIPDLREFVTKEFTGSFEVVRYMDVVSRVLTNEAEFRKTHWAFYHTMSNDWTVWQDVLTKLYNHFNPSAQKKNDEFVFFRIKGQKRPQQAKSFLLTSLREYGLVDDNNEAAGILLSTNLSLFGNTGLGSESSWRYFMKEKEHSMPTEERYAEIMDEFDLPHTYIKELMELGKLLETKQQTLVQIFVPKNMIDEVGYLAWATGIPAHQATIDWVRDNVAKRIFKGRAGKPGALWALLAIKDKFKKEQEKNPLFKEMLENIEKGDYSLNAYLNLFCNKPWDLPNINYVQARLLFAEDILLNPESGVKMFRHTEVNYRKKRTYERRLDEIIGKIIAAKGSSL